MARKKKEKPLTLEEALEQIKDTLKGLWFQSPPLIAALSPEPDAPLQAFPLDLKFTQKTWCIAFIDPTSLERDYLLSFVIQLQQRYARVNFGLIIVFIPRYLQFSQPEAIQSFLQRRKLNLPICIDEDFRLCKALGITEYPSVAILSQETATLVHKSSGTKILEDLEKHLRDALWKYDPGLSFPSPLEVPSKSLYDSDSLDLAPGEGAEPQKTQIKISPHGIWKPLDGALTTEDPDASIDIEFKGTELAIVGLSLSAKQTASRIFLDMDEVKKTQHGPDVSAEDAGSLVLRLEAARRLYCLKGLQDEVHKVTLRFPDTIRIGVALLGIRVGTNRP